MIATQTLRYTTQYTTTHHTTMRAWGYAKRGGTFWCGRLRLRAEQALPTCSYVVDAKTVLRLREMRGVECQIRAWSTLPYSVHPTGMKYEKNHCRVGKTVRILPSEHPAAITASETRARAQEELGRWW